MEVDSRSAPRKVGPVKVVTPKLSLSSALNQKLRLRQRWLKANHHLTFMRKCLMSDVVPKGLRMHKELQCMEASSNTDTLANIQDVLKNAEQTSTEL